MIEVYITDALYNVIKNKSYLESPRWAAHSSHLVNQPVPELLSPYCNRVPWIDAKIVIIKNNKSQDLRMGISIHLWIPGMRHIPNCAVRVVIKHRGDRSYDECQIVAITLNLR
jgi:hypothetical protein